MMAVDLTARVGKAINIALSKRRAEALSISLPPTLAFEVKSCQVHAIQRRWSAASNSWLLSWPA